MNKVIFNLNDTWLIIARAEYDLRPRGETDFADWLKEALKFIDKASSKLRNGKETE